MKLITFMICMTDVKLLKRGNINKSRTTISVRLGTKHKLLEVADKGESFDDIISRLISTNEKLENDLMNCKNILDAHKISETNIIESYKLERSIDSIIISGGDQIRFSYNKPIGWPYNESYQMDIIIEKVIGQSNRDILNKIKNDPEQRILVHLWMVGRIINKHFDSAYEIPLNKMLIDPIYWRQVWQRNKLPESSYLHDILKEINLYEESLND